MNDLIISYAVVIGGILFLACTPAIVRWLKSKNAPKPEPETAKPPSEPAPTWRSSPAVQSYRRVGDYGPTSFDGPSYPSVKYQEPKKKPPERTNKTPTWRQCPEPPSSEPVDDLIGALLVSSLESTVSTSNIPPADLDPPSLSGGGGDFGGGGSDNSSSRSGDW